MIYQRFYRSWIGILKTANSTYFNILTSFQKRNSIVLSGSVDRPLLHPLLHHRYHHHCGIHHSCSHHKASADLPLHHPSPARHHPQALQHQTYHHNLSAGHHTPTHHHLHGGRHHDRAAAGHHHSPRRRPASPQGPEALQLPPLPPRGNLRGRRQWLQLQVPRRARGLRVWEGWAVFFFFFLDIRN